MPTSDYPPPSKNDGLNTDDEFRGYRIAGAIIGVLLLLLCGIGLCNLILTVAR